jgi:hypothetical protein
LDSIHLDEHFVKVPFRSEPNSLLPQLGGGNGAELLAPFPDRFLRHWDAPLRHHLFDIPIAQGKAKVQPYALLHNLDRETVPTISALRRFHNASFSHFLKLTMPGGPQARPHLSALSNFSVLIVILSRLSWRRLR